MVCIPILFCAVIIRVLGAANDLTLDEIVSLNNVNSLSSPTQVFTKLHVDNNHYLNSLWLYAAGGRGNWPGYRILSVLAGIGTVAMAWLIGRRRGAATAWIAMFLTAFSYVLVLYSGQARGYSCQVFFSFLCWHLLEIYAEKRTLRVAALFWFGAVAGFLSHLGFVTFFAATIPWLAWRLFRLGLHPPRIAGAALLSHLPPSLFLGALYLVDVRQLTVLGGTPTTLFNGYSTSLAWLLPPAAQGAWTLAMFLIVAAGLAAGCWVLWREKSDLPVFFVGVILVFPCLLVIFRGASLLYVRYFITGIAFALLLLSILLAALWTRGPRGRALCLALLLAYGTANGRCIWILLRENRGDYSEAVRVMMKQSTRPVITVSGDLDFRINTVLKFYCGQLLGDRQEHYYPWGNWIPGGTEWMIYQKESDEPPVPKRTTIADGQGNRYSLVKIIPAAPLAAQHWFLYHNKAMESGTAGTPQY